MKYGREEDVQLLLDQYNDCVIKNEIIHKFNIAFTDIQNVVLEYKNVGNIGNFSLIIFFIYILFFISLKRKKRKVRKVIFIFVDFKVKQKVIVLIDF